LPAASHCRYSQASRRQTLRGCRMILTEAWLPSISESWLDWRELVTPSFSPHPPLPLLAGGGSAIERRPWNRATVESATVESSDCAISDCGISDCAIERLWNHHQTGRMTRARPSFFASLCVLFGLCLPRVRRFLPANLVLWVRACMQATSAVVILPVQTASRRLCATQPCFWH
jgi:hypothetical protein